MGERKTEHPSAPPPGGPSSPARILYGLAGSPAQPGAKTLPGPRACRICGLPVQRAIPFARWIAPGATDWSSWQGPPEEPQVVCEACAWVRSGSPSTTVPWSPGAALTTGLRMYSHLWDEVLAGRILGHPVEPVRELPPITGWAPYGPWRG